MVVGKVVEEYVGHLQGPAIGEHAFNDVSRLAVDDGAPGAGGVHLELSGWSYVKISIYERVRKRIRQDFEIVNWSSGKTAVKQVSLLD